MKKVFIPFLLAGMLIGCSKETEEELPNESSKVHFKLNQYLRQYDSNQVQIKGEEFCGERLYSFICKSQSNMFLISIVTDTLRSGVYMVGANYWGENFNAASDFNMKLEVIYQNGIVSGIFSGKLIQDSIRQMQVTNGVIKPTQVIEY